MVTYEELKKLADIYDLNIHVTCGKITKGEPNYKEGFSVNIGLKPSKFKIFPSWVDAIFLTAYYNNIGMNKDVLNICDELKCNEYGEYYFGPGHFDFRYDAKYEDLERIVTNLFKRIKEINVKKKLERIDDDFGN